MNFDFSDEQKLFQDQVRRSLSDICRPTEVRRVLETDNAHSAPTWEALVALGVMAAPVPEAFGGLGLGSYELCLAAFEAGRALAPVPLAGSMYLAVQALLLADNRDLQAEWLPQVASGRAWLGFAEDGDLRLVGGRLHGVARPAWDCSGAAAAIVQIHDAGRRILALVDLAGEVQSRSLASVDPSRDVAELSFHGAKVQPLQASASGDLPGRVRDRAAVLLAFEQLGAAERALEMARDYALQRYAFGRPIGSYQAIKHKLANVYIRIELARAHAYYGAWALSTDASDLPLAAAAARVAATEAFTLAAQENIQTHGGIGYAWESDCHLFYRRARLQALQLGSVLEWKERLMGELDRRNAA